MSFDDETLMAYADGELAPDVRAQVERAMREDPEVAAAVERHRALRADVFSALAGVLDEPVPQRLQPQAAPVQAHVRVDALASAGARPLPARWSWRQWGGMAASLAAGVLAGALGWQQLRGLVAAPF
jgi:anti-sigma factor RsiW